MGTLLFVPAVAFLMSPFPASVAVSFEVWLHEFLASLPFLRKVGRLSFPVVLATSFTFIFSTFTKTLTIFTQRPGVAGSWVWELALAVFALAIITPALAYRIYVHGIRVLLGLLHVDFEFVTNDGLHIGDYLVSHEFIAVQSGTLHEQVFL